MNRAAILLFLLLPWVQGQDAALSARAATSARAAIKKEVKIEVEEEHERLHLTRIYETPEEALPWHIIFGVSGLISPFLLLLVVINRMYFKMTRIGKEQEDLKMLLRSYGFEEHHPLVSNLINFYY